LGALQSFFSSKSAECDAQPLELFGSAACQYYNALMLNTPATAQQLYNKKDASLVYVIVVCRLNNNGHK